MGKSLIERYSSKGLKRALAAGAAFGLLGSGSLAQVTDPQAPLALDNSWSGFAASISPRVSYSDNLRLAPDGFRDDEYIVSALLSGGAVISTQRISGLVLGDLDFSQLIDDGDFVVNQNLGAAATATIADNLFYIDVAGRTARDLVGDNARFSGNLNAARDQRANVHSLTASPYIYRRFADLSSVEARYRFSQTFIDDSGSAFRGGLNDSQSHEALVSYESGGLFDTVRFRVGAYGNMTEEMGADGPSPVFEYDQGSVFSEAQFALSRSVFLSGAVGYDEIDTKAGAALFFVDEDLSGVFWRAGVTLRPGRRSNMRIEYGERYGDDFIDADLRYQISDRVSLSARAVREFQTRVQGVNARFRGAQTDTLDYIDRLREGASLEPRGVIEAANQYADTVNGRGAQTSGVRVTDRASAVLAANLGRTTATLSANYNDSDFGFREIETIAGRLNIRRDLSRKATVQLGVDYRHTDSSFTAAQCEVAPILFGFSFFGDDDVATFCAEASNGEAPTHTVVARAGLAYQLYKNVSAFGEYAHSQRFSDLPSLEYGENIVTLGVILDF